MTARTWDIPTWLLPPISAESSPLASPSPVHRSAVRYLAAGAWLCSSQVGL